MFWEELPDSEERTDEKKVLFTFQAVASAVKAFSFSFPVIFMDACFVKCPGTTAQLMTASFMTSWNCAEREHRILGLFPGKFEANPVTVLWNYN